MMAVPKFSDLHREGTCRVTQCMSLAKCHDRW